MNEAELTRVREAVQRRLLVIDPDPPYFARYRTSSERSARRQFGRECLQNAWSKEDPQAVALAQSLGLLDSLPETVAEMDLPMAGQLRYVWRNEPHNMYWHVLVWAGWDDTDSRSLCKVMLRGLHGQSERPDATCWRCEAKLAKLRKAGVSVG
jgi:hypothetical protein